MLEVKNLKVRVEDKEILRGVNLTVNTGEVHAIMGPNGSGKSTLARAIAGHPGYEVTEGQILYKGQDLLEMDPDERAREGVFMAFQYPVEIAGVNNAYFLKAALNAKRKHHGQPELDAMEFMQLVGEKSKLLDIDKSMLSRAVNEGFSGGEKKRNEIFQMALLEPKLAIRNTRSPAATWSTRDAISSTWIRTSVPARACSWRFSTRWKSPASTTPTS